MCEPGRDRCPSRWVGAHPSLGEKITDALVRGGRVPELGTPETLAREVRSTEHKATAKAGSAQGEEKNPGQGTGSLQGPEPSNKRPSTAHKAQFKRIKLAKTPYTLLKTPDAKKTPLAV